jgi:polyhydroxyalkanoate synthase subunit PhaC
MMKKTSPAGAAPPPAAAAAGDGGKPDAFGAAVAGLLKSAQGLNLPAQQLARIQGDYLHSATEMWNQALQRLQPAPESKPAGLGDRRFAGTEWLANPVAATTAQMYLLNARTLMQTGRQCGRRREDQVRASALPCSSGSTRPAPATSWRSTPRR